MPVGLNKKDKLAILQQQKAKSSQFMKETRELREKNEKHLEEHRKHVRKLLDYIDNKDIDSKYKDMLNDAFDDGEIKTKSDVDKYIKDNNLLKSDKSKTTKKIKEAIKDIKTDNTKKGIKRLIEDVEKTPIKGSKKSKSLIKAVDLGFEMASQPNHVKSKKSKTLNKAMNLAFEMVNQPKGKKYDKVEDIEDIIKEVDKISKATKSQKKKLVKADEMHIKYHPSEQDKKELKMDKDILLEPYKYKNMNLVDQIAESLKNPEFEGIKKKKIINSYSYDTISKFNKKYPELMLKLFKTEEGVEKVLKKKADKSEKNKLSDIKKAARLKKYAEKAKALRQEKKAVKTKHLRDLTPEETKKFTQARNYYMRKSKTSDILPKELNKTDPEGLNSVCRDIAVDGFNTMSEHLFMKYYEG